MLLFTKVRCPRSSVSTDEVREVTQGFECGMAFENYQDVKAGDVIECFDVEEIARRLIDVISDDGAAAERLL